MRAGGAERAVFQLVCEQRRRGVLADLAIASDPGSFGEQLNEAGGTVHLLRCRGAWDIGRSLKLTKIASRYPIVHVHGIEPLLIFAVSRADCVPVYTHRGGARDYGWTKRCRQAAARPYVRRFAAISGNTTHSAYVVARWLGLPVERIAVVHNGLNFALLEPTRTRADVLAELRIASGSASLIVGTASTLQPWKRVELLLQALAETADDIHCVVLGDGPSRDDLEGLTIMLGIADRVTFLGRKDHVGDYLQLLDAFVLPSGPEEAFGNAAVEAMGVGVPTVIFGDGGGLTEHVIDGKTGLIVRDVSELTTSLLRLRNDAQFRAALGAAGREFVRRSYSLDAMFERYEAFYDAALRSLRSPTSTQ